MEADDGIAKATDENLTSENWEFIMDVVDKVGSEPTGGKDVVASLIKRLAHRNANVQLYTLEVCSLFRLPCQDENSLDIACERSLSKLRKEDSLRTRLPRIH